MIILDRNKFLNLIDFAYISEQFKTIYIII